MNDWINKHKKYIILIVALALACVLCLFPLKLVLKIPAVICLKNNLDFIRQFIERYSCLATVTIIVFIIILLAQNFSVNSTTMKLMGIEFQLKNTEKNVKIQIKNYLSTKRSVFVLYKEYDNYYDVINSMYDILLFLRKQIANFDNFSQTNNECYKKIEGMIKEIGCFLTKYQSDYRRYYSTNIERDSKDFIPFKDIQNGYFQVSEMENDLYQLNIKMKPYAIFFFIFTDKCSNWY